MEFVNVHPATACAGRACVVHRPSEHHMLEWEPVWRQDKGMIERLCRHGIGHPDPDDLAYHVGELGKEWAGVHSCDGCCVRS